MKKWPWIVGGVVAGGILLCASAAGAAKPPQWLPRGTRDEDRFNDALRRLGNFIQAARIDAKAYRLDVADGMVLGVRPGPAFVVEDSRALPKRLDGIDIVIDGWPR